MGKTKTKKMRGSRNCGYGISKNHRGKGSHGGKGFAGSKEHRMLKFKKECPEHYDHRVLKKLKIDIANVLNVGELGEFKGTEINGTLTINLTEMGYDKLLGNGEIKGKFKVIVQSWSVSAEEKVKAAGGEVVEE
jgi:large subunit ribosomal protein L15